MFKEQYIRDNEKLHAKEALFMEISEKLKQEDVRQVRRNRFVRYGAIAAAALLVLGGTVGVLTAMNRTAPAAQSAQASQVLQAEPAGDYAELYRLVSEAGGSYRETGIGATVTSGVTDDGMEMAEENAMEEPAATDVSADTGSTSSSADYSDTNVQVAGVDEADIVKTDGAYIYYVVNNMLYIAKADGADTKLVSHTEFDASGSWYASDEMYLLGDRLMIICRSYKSVWVEREGYETGHDNTSIILFDVTDRANPVKLTTLGQSGNYVSSRRVGDYVYIITSQYIYDAVQEVPVTYVPTTSVDGTEATLPASDVLVYSTPQTSAYTVIGAVNLKSGTAHETAKAVFGGTGDVYCSGAHLLLAQDSYTQDVSEIQPDKDGRNVQITRSESNTSLVLFALDGASIEKLASGSVPGTLLNQFAMDEYDGVLRIVTTVNRWEERIYTDGVDTYEYDDENYNNLYTLDMELNVLGKIENLAEDEWVESVRFDGTIGYFVTFRQTDPLFSVDLSDPAKPRILSTLKIPGFSEYLHVYDDGLLLGLGYAADETTGVTEGVKLSMFDVSDKANVTELNTARLDADWTAVGSNHRAILVSTEKKLVAFPADNAYYIYTYTAESGFELLKKVGVSDDLWSANLRGLFINDAFYVLSERGITVISMDTWEQIGRIVF